MSDKDKELKAFNQCADALSALSPKSIVNVFKLLTVHYEMMLPSIETGQRVEDSSKLDPVKQLPLTLNHSINARNGGSVDEPTKTKKARAKSSSKGPTYLADFDFAPTGKEKLKDYVKRYNPKTYFERNLVFVQYLQEIGTDSITADHVYSCYRHLGGKIPSFPQTLIDTKARKGWIDTAVLNDIKVLRAGLNHLQDLEVKVVSEPYA